MTPGQGTPTTLDGAIKNAFKDPRDLPIEEKLWQHIRDFSSQRFSVAMMQEENGLPSQILLKDLFESIVKRDK